MAFDVWTIDHKIPISRGGTNSLDNQVGCCYDCNTTKSLLTEQEFFSLEYNEASQVVSNTIAALNTKIAIQAQLKAAEQLDKLIAKKADRAIIVWHRNLLARKVRKTRKLGYPIPYTVLPILDAANDWLRTY